MILAKASELQAFFCTNYNQGDTIVVVALDDKEGQKPRGERFYAVGSCFSTVAAWADEKQSNGCGIYFTANPTNGSTKADGQPLRTEDAVADHSRLWFDIDYGLKQPLPFEPTYLLQTSTKDGMPKFQGQLRIDASVTKEQQKNLLKRLIAAVGGDPSTSNTNRLLRLPYSLHLKGEPQQTQLLKQASTVVSASELDRLLPSLKEATAWIQEFKRQEVLGNALAFQPLGMKGSGLQESLPTGDSPTEPTIEVKPVSDLPVVGDSPQALEETSDNEPSAEVYARHIIGTLLQLPQGAKNATTNRLVFLFYSMFWEADESYLTKFAQALSFNSPEPVEFHLEKFRHARTDALKKPAEDATALLEQLYGKRTPGELKLLSRIRLAYDGRLAWDDLCLTPYLDGKEITEDTLDVMRLTDMERWGSAPDAQYVKLMISMAKANPFNAITNYIRSLKPELADTKHLPNLEVVYVALGIGSNGVDKVLERRMVRAYLIAMVARAVEPGCQADNTLVLFGAQGQRKTSFFRALVPDGLFQTATAMNADKDSLMTLRRTWLTECGEFETVYSRSEAGAIKNFVTKTEDSYRIPYARSVQSHKRQFAFCGTTNKREFLIDETGNRRFWVVDLSDHGKIDTDAVVSVRDGLWAEILALYNSGEKWHLDEVAEAAVRENNLSHTEEDVAQQAVVNYVKNKGGVGFTIADICKAIYDTDTDQRHARSVKRILTQLQCPSKRPKINGKQASTWVYYAPESWTDVVRAEAKTVPYYEEEEYEYDESNALPPIEGF
jgi:Virulence-associated protein E